MPLHTHNGGAADAKRAAIGRVALLLDFAALRTVTPLALAQSPGMTYMGRPLDFKEWSHLKEIYELPPELPSLVLIKGSQTGGTLVQLIRMLTRKLRIRPINQIYAVPTDELIKSFAKKRFPDLVAGLPESKRAVLEPSTFTLDYAQLGQSLMFWRKMSIGHSHSVSTESIPADALCVDEVRRAAPVELGRLAQRVAASALQIEDYLSTAGPPGCLIDAFWNESDQRVFHSKCDCPGGISIAHEWPKSVRRAGRGATARVEFICPKCGKVIINPRKGLWIPLSPRSTARVGYHLPQTLSPVQTAETLLSKWERCNLSASSGMNRYFFLTDILGLVVDDPETRLVRPEVLEAWKAGENPYRWHSPPEIAGPQFAAPAWPVAQGWDVMQDLAVGFTLTFDLEREIFVVIWLDYRYGPDPWGFVARRISEYRPQLVVVDAGPDFNESLKLCRQYPGTVWRALYKEAKADVVNWGKVDFSKEASKDAASTQFEVSIRRGMAIKAYVGEYINQRRLFLPKLDTYPGRPGDHAGTPAPELVLEHLTSVSVATEVNQRTGSVQTVMYEKAGIDPHAVHALLYALVALEQNLKFFGPSRPVRFSDPRASY